YSNENYHFALGNTRYVIRLPGLKQAHHDRHFEKTLRLALPGKLTPPAVAEDVERGVLITSYIDAPLLIDQSPVQEQLISLFRDLTLNLTHLPQAVVGRTYNPYAMSGEYMKGCDIPGAVRELLNRTWHPQNVTLCHNDLNPWNVLVLPDGEFMLLDWEMAGLNDPVFDMVTLIEGLQRESSEVADLYERVFDQPLNPQRLSACQIAFWLREYAWAAGQLKAGNVREGIAAQHVTAYTRLQALM
ncbi:MAG: phosphotransferase, partial [Proteobacteria bacterium]|nr:phosphotransferase [Pseudomonadota bacterium]